MIAAIGLDGATWSIIKPNLDKLPTFRQLLDRSFHSTLLCDVRPVHSAPSWTTLFTGLKTDEHAITNFVMEENARQALLRKKLFLWDRIQKSQAMCVPLALPPINHQYELKDWESVVLSITREEMRASTDRLLKDVKEAVQSKALDFLAVVFPETDRAQHIFWHQPQVVLEHYQHVDAMLAQLMPMLEREDFLILSDHGFTDAAETRRNNWDTVRENQTGGHHPEGIAISNRPCPQRVSEVYAFLKQIAVEKGIWV